MSDFAHDWTDQKIDELRGRFRAAYMQAASEMQEKISEHLADFDAENKDWKAKLSSGEVSKSEYKAWLESQARRKDFLIDMADTLAKDAANVNMLVADYINDTVPEVYAENANFAAYGIDSSLHANTHAFDLYDISTVRRMIAIGETAKDANGMPLILPKAKPDKKKSEKWNHQKFVAALTQSILQGESIPNTAKRLAGVLGMDERAMVKAARTAMTGAENAGRIDSYQRAKKIGIDLEQEWLATLDLRTRMTHRELDGQHVPVGENFHVKSQGHDIAFPGDPTADPSEVWNCFIGETKICANSQIEKSYCHEYKGELVTIDTATGIHFTCTPNHPILTSSGWVPAKSLHDGDNLLVTGVRDVKVSRGNPNVDHVFPSMKALHELLCVLSSKRAAGLSVNFHGDVAASNVEVVAKESFLRLGINTSRFKRIIELALKGTNPLYLGKRPSMEGILRVPLSASRVMRRLRVCASLLWGHGLHADIHGLRASARLDSSFTEYAIDNLPAETMVRSELLSGLSGQVLSDEVIGVKVSYTRGTQVYNLQTGNGYYFANQSDNGNFIIAKNCRCTLVAWFPEDGEESMADRWSRLPEGMTYEQWKGLKEDEEGKGIKNDGNPTDLGGVVRGKPMSFDEADKLKGNPNYNMAQEPYHKFKKAEKTYWDMYNKAFDTGKFDKKQLDTARNAMVQAKKEYEKARKQQLHYRDNCQTCVVANEARRRGYDVQATPNLPKSVNSQLSYDTALAWIDPKTGKKPVLTSYDGKGKPDALGRPIPTYKRYIEWLESDGVVVEGERYTIELSWKKGSGGHIVCLERVKGELRMYDPQSGKKYFGTDVHEYLKKAKMKRTSYGESYACAPELLMVSGMQFNKTICDQILIGGAK